MQGGSKFGTTLRAPVSPIQQTPNYALWGVLEGWVQTLALLADFLFNLSKKLFMKVPLLFLKIQCKNELSWQAVQV